MLVGWCLVLVYKDDAAIWIRNVGPVAILVSLVVVLATARGRPRVRSVDAALA